MACFSSSTGWAQSTSTLNEPTRVCGSANNPEELRRSNPEKYQELQRGEQLTQRYLTDNHYTIDKTNSSKESTGQRVSDPQVTITIPVVVHVVWNTPAQNISLEQIQSQIDVLNEDFRRRNADANQTPAVFQGVAADANIEFKLACIDPNGNSTNGVVRANTQQRGFTVVPLNANEVNEQATGLKFVAGAAAWPADRYLNIWTYNGLDNIGGYAQFPGLGNPNTDGVAIIFNAFGRGSRFQLLGSNNKGRITTHEIGHWLSLRHIWGDANCGDDLCTDTPTQQNANSGCPGFPHVTCSNQGDMSMNYMDYTNDECRNLFTNMQRGRMRSLFAAGGARESFISARIQQTASFYCTGGPYTFSVAVPEGPAPVYNWSVTGWLQITSGQGTNQITCTSQIAPEGHQASISVSANGYCETKQITYGVPLFYNGDVIDTYSGQRSPLGGSNGVPEYSTVQFPYEDLTTYQFDQIGGGYAQVTRAFDNECDIYMPSYATDGLTVRITKTNPCGTVTQDFYFEPNYYYRYSPNPANDYVVVEAVSGSSPQSTPNAAGFDATLYDNYGRQVKTKRSTGGQATIDIRALPNGLYNLRVGQGKKAISKHIQITH